MMSSLPSSLRRSSSMFLTKTSTTTIGTTTTTTTTRATTRRTLHLLPSTTTGRKQKQQQRQQQLHRGQQNKRRQQRYYYNSTTATKKSDHSYSAIQLRLFSSTSNSNSNSGSSGSGNRGPVVLSKTPRSKKRKQSVSSSKEKLLNGTNTTITEHTTTHYIKGGLPCDPIPPQPFRLENYGENSLYTLILLRHGESEWNALNNYTGWCDVQLTSRGIQEAINAGKLLKQYDIELDHAFTSLLQRASRTLNLALQEAQQHWVPVTKTWRLNERHYGALQGYNKDTAYRDLNLDQELVMQMRRSYDVRPPKMENDHPYWHGNDRRYQRLSKEQLELTRAESLKDTADRIMPFYRSIVLPSLTAGNKCLIVSHANTIRTLIKHIDNISDEDIKGMSIPTGLPLVYRLDQDFKPVDPTVELEFRYMIQPKGYTWATDHAHGFHGVYLGDIERLQDIQGKRDQTNRTWQRIILKKCVADLFSASGSVAGNVADTRQIWFRINNKIENHKDYNNMLLLMKMRDEIEYFLYSRRRKHITKTLYERLLDKITTNTQGQVVEPFLDLSDRQYRNKKQQDFYDNNVDYFSPSAMEELEEECLIK